MTYILYNTHAGNQHIESELEALISSFQIDAIKKDVISIDYRTFIPTLTKEDCVILCGGDGTLNHFVNDSDGLEVPCDVLYYPAGSGNDFAHDIGCATHDKPVSVKNYLQNLPLAEVNGKTYRFINNVGFGIDGYCCEVGDMLKEKSDKPVNYTAIAIKGCLFHFKPRKAIITVDGKTYEYENVWIAPTMKGRYYGGGMMATPEQDRNDPENKLSVMVFHNANKWQVLMTFPSIFKGEHIKKEKYVTIHTGHDIHVSFDRPTPLQIDGETILGVTEYSVKAKVPSKIG